MTPTLMDAVVKTSDDFHAYYYFMDVNHQVLFWFVIELLLLDIQWSLRIKDTLGPI